MSRFLLVFFNAGGQVPPQLAIAKLLVRAGHEVTLLVPPSLEGRAAETGCEVVLFERITEFRFGERPAEEFASLRRYVGSLGLAEDVVAELERRPADVVVADCTLAAALAGAERARTTAVAVVPFLYVPWNERWGRFGIEVNATREALGLPRLAEETPRELTKGLRRILVAAPASFDYPARTKDPRVRYVARVVDPDPPDPWASPWPPDNTDPLVVVTLSGLFRVAEKSVQRVIDVLGELPVRVLLLLAGRPEGEALQLPQNTVVQSWVPHDAVLPKAALAVTNAGLGTTIAGLSYGVPQLCLPLSPEQQLNGVRVHQLGAGRLLADGAGRRKVRKALEDVLHSDAYRSAARQVAVSFERDGGARAVGELEACARGED